MSLVMSVADVLQTASCEVFFTRSLQFNHHNTRETIDYSSS
ncbi:hypothetical protein MY5147_005183 [Beauveria neobassiana]